MAANEVLIVVKADDKASATIDDVTKKSGGLKSALGNVAKIGGPVAAIAGIGALGAGLISATQAAAEDKQEVEKLRQTYINATGSVKGFEEWMNKSVKAGARLAFTDSEIRDGLNLLTLQGHGAAEAQRRLAIAQDLSRSTGMDLQLSTKLVGKISGETTEVLKKYGITLGDNMTEEEALSAVQAKVAGAAQTYADSTAGRQEQLKIKFQELKETIGAKLLPIMEKLTIFMLEKAIPWMEKISAEYGPKVEKAFKDISAVVEALWPIIKFAVENAIVRLEGFAMVVQSVYEIIDRVISLVDNLIHGRWEAAWADAKAIPEQLLNLLIGSLMMQFGSLPEMLAGEIAKIPGRLLSLGGSFMDAGKGLGRAFGNGIISLFNSALNRIRIPGGSIGIGPAKISWPALDPIPDNPIPHLARGGLVTRSGLAEVHEGEVFSGVGRGFGPTVHLHVAGSIVSERDILRIVRDAAQAGGFAGVNFGAIAG